MYLNDRRGKLRLHIYGFPWPAGSNAIPYLRERAQLRDCPTDFFCSYLSCRPRKNTEKFSPGLMTEFFALSFLRLLSFSLSLLSRLGYETASSALFGKRSWRVCIFKRCHERMCELVGYKRKKEARIS